MKLLPFLSFVFVTGLAAQSASFTTFGSNCGGANAATISARGLPRLNSTYNVDYTGPHTAVFVQACIYRHNQPIHLLGVSRTAWGTLPLPFAVPAALTGGDPTCLLQVSIEASHAMPQIGNLFQTTIAIQVPNDPALLGAQVFHQWMLRISTVDRLCQPITYLFFSDAGVAQFGT